MRRGDRTAGFRVTLVVVAVPAAGITFWRDILAQGC